MGCSERQTELKRRQKRRKKLTLLGKRLEKATVSERAEIVRKIRELTPGADAVIARLQLGDADR